MKLHHKQLSTITLLVFIVLSTHAQAQVKRFKAADSKGVTATRDDNSIYLKIDADIKSPIVIPRLAAPLHSMHWQGVEGDADALLKPSTDTWSVQWKNRPQNAETLVLKFDATPLLISEIKPIEASGDGSYYLPAHKAILDGEKIRYEPQPQKNTVGFWVGKQDSAGWDFKLDKPGRFNVAILQGCGKGQGGSATMSFLLPRFKMQVSSVDFDVLETGHFQNFHWRTLGEIDLTDTGEFHLIVVPRKFNKAALMDIRAIHLIRLPDKKK